MSRRSAVRWAVLPADSRPPAGSQWARLGDTVLVWVSPESARLREAAEDNVRAGTADGLRLVTQVGASFQQAYPDVAVLVDRGRHLVVDAAALPDVEEDDICWRVRPLAANAVVVDRPDAFRRPADPRIEALIAVLSLQAYESDLRDLCAHRTRHSLSEDFSSAVEWSATRLTSLGYTVRTVPVAVGSVSSATVIADRDGMATGPERGVVAITAHLDSVNLPGGPAAPAPGADDNASGAAGILELARVFAEASTEHALRVILFGGEEQGLLGSRQYVAGLPGSERARIRAVLNLDMVAGRNTPQPGVLIEGADVSATLVADLASGAATYTRLTVSTSLSPFASDHVPFIDAGIPAVLTIEGSDSANTNIHSDRDTLDHLDLTLAAEILRMNIAAVARWLEV